MNQIGRYEIQRVLGRGAMGVVYAAIDPLIGRQVAIKTIRLGALEAGADYAELAQRLQREARAAGVLSHPGIVTIHDVGQHRKDAYIVMEFIDGRTLEEMLGSTILRSFSMLLPILRKTADALDYAHTKGIIHRDVKPSNIMICPDGTVKIADFGIAKLSASSALTQSGSAIGTPNYMSPEQAQGRAVDGRSDQFSLAVVAYRMLSGKLPFEGPTLTAILAKILWEEPEYDSAGLHPPIRPVLQRALAKDPQMRYRTCTEFVRELGNAYADHRAEGPRANPSSVDRPAAKVPAAVEADSNSSSVGPTIAGQAPGRKSVFIAWTASLGILLLAIVVFFAIRAIKKPAPSFQKISTDPVATLGNSAAKASPASDHLSPPKKQEVRATPSRTSAPIDPPQIVLPRKISVPESKPLSAHAPHLDPTSGVLTWSGSLEKNSILIISDSATIGSVSGKWPGKPMEIEVIPKDLTIRQRPSAINGWNQIILYSGNRKYSNITIHWKIIN